MRAVKTLAVARKQGDSNVVRTCLRTQLTTELNQKLTKHSLKTLDTGHLHWEKYLCKNSGVKGKKYLCKNSGVKGKKYLCKNLGVKEGGGHLLEGGVFLGTYGTVTRLHKE